MSTEGSIVNAGCQEPIGISFVTALCEDPVNQKCVKCGLMLCLSHLEKHKARHEVLDNIQVFRAACDRPGCNAAFTGESQKLAESYLNFHKRQKHKSKRVEDNEFA